MWLKIHGGYLSTLVILQTKLSWRRVSFLRHRNSPLKLLLYELAKNMTSMNFMAHTNVWELLPHWDCEVFLRWIRELITTATKMDMPRQFTKHKQCSLITNQWICVRVKGFAWTTQNAICTGWRKTISHCGGWLCAENQCLWCFEFETHLMLICWENMGPWDGGWGRQWTIHSSMRWLSH